MSDADTLQKITNEVNLLSNPTVPNSMNTLTTNTSTNFNVGNLYNPPYIYLVILVVNIIVLFLIQPKALMKQDEHKNYILDKKKLFIFSIITTILTIVLLKYFQKI